MPRRTSRPSSTMKMLMTMATMGLRMKNSLMGGAAG
jgi:hypothetical protein